MFHFLEVKYLPLIKAAVLCSGIISFWSDHAIVKGKYSSDYSLHLWMKPIFSWKMFQFCRRNILQWKTVLWGNFQTTQLMMENWAAVNILFSSSLNLAPRCGNTKLKLLHHFLGCSRECSHCWNFTAQEWKVQAVVEGTPGWVIILLCIS